MMLSALIPFIGALAGGLIAFGMVVMIHQYDMPIRHAILVSILLTVFVIAIAVFIANHYDNSACAVCGAHVDTPFCGHCGSPVS